MINKTTNKVFFDGHLHWIIFMCPIGIILLGMLARQFNHVYVLGWPIILAGGVLFVRSLLNYLSSSIQVTESFLIIKTGILRRQTLNVSIPQLESIDVMQSLLGCFLNYGSLSVRGTGGTCAVFGPMANPLTCRRFLESMPEV